MLQTLRVTAALTAVGAVISALLIAGCSSLPNGGDPAPSSSPTGAGLVPYEDWRSDTPPTDVVELTEDEKVQYRADMVKQARAQLKQQFGIDAPKVDLVRWTDRDEFARMLVKCLDQEGFSTHLIGTSGIGYDDPIPASQTAALQLAMYKCKARHTRDPTFLQPMTPEQRGVVYDYFVTWLTPCLTGLGFQIDDPPSRETYISKHAWDPYVPLMRSGQFTEDSEDGAKILAACPRQPPVAAMYP